MANYYWLQGAGHAIVNGVTMPFKRGDVLTCPAWTMAFFNDGDDDMVMFAIHHDLPTLA